MFKRLSNDTSYNMLVTLTFWIIGMFLLVIGYFAFTIPFKPVITALETTTIVLPGGDGKPFQTTWRKQLGAKGMPLYIKCNIDRLCMRGLHDRPMPGTGMIILTLGLASIFTGFSINGLLKRRRDMLDDAKWLAVDEYKHPEIKKYMLGEIDEKTKEVIDPVIVPLGYVIEQQPLPTNITPNRPIQYKYYDLKKIGLTSKMLQEHVLVYGPTGTGKTSRVLMHFIYAFAKRGDAVVLPDFKFPTFKESFMEALVIFRRMGRNVWPILPYSPGGYHIPLFDSIQTPQDGRDVAAILIPELEFGVSDAEFWKQTQQIILGSVLRTVARSAVPTFYETIRVMRLPLKEFEHWLKQSGDTEAIDQLTRFFQLRDADWNNFITGILNGLEPFDDDRVNRTFTSDPKKNFNPRQFITQGGLLYWGTPTDKMRTKRGETITRIFDNWLTNEIVKLRSKVLETGPQKSVRLLYDEAPSLGRLRNVLKSLATLRTFDVSFIFGIQNESQMELAYSDKEWEAMTGNLATQIILPTGFKDRAAKTLSGFLGEREIRVQGSSRQEGTGGILESAITAKHGKNIRVQTRPLVTPAEIEEWPYFLGILRTKGTLPPALLAVVPFFKDRLKQYGLDKREYTINNTDLYNEYIELMDDLTPAEREAEALEYIAETVTPDDLNKHLPTTLKDLFNEWVRFAIMDGTVFRRKGDGTFEFRYDSVDASLRSGEAQRVVLAFVRSGWFDPGEAIAETPREWDNIRVTQSGMASLSPYVQAELKNVRFLSEYIHARKALHLAAATLSGGILEARELLPVETAYQATFQLLRRQDVHLKTEDIEAATKLMMSRFTRATVNNIEMVAIPLNFPFEYVIAKVLKIVEGDEDTETLDRDWSQTQPAETFMPAFNETVLNLEQAAEEEARKQQGEQAVVPREAAEAEGERAPDLSYDLPQSEAIRNPLDVDDDDDEPFVPVSQVTRASEAIHEEPKDEATEGRKEEKTQGQSSFHPSVSKDVQTEGTPAESSPAKLPRRPTPAIIDPISQSLESPRPATASADAPLPAPASPASQEEEDAPLPPTGRETASTAPVTPAPPSPVPVQPAATDDDGPRLFDFSEDSLQAIVNQLAPDSTPEGGTPNA